MGNSIDPCHHESNQFQENSIVKFFSCTFMVKKGIYDVMMIIVVGGFSH